MGFDLLNRIKANSNYDEQGRSPEIEGNVEFPNQDAWKNANRRNIKGSAQCNTGQNSVYIVRCLFPGTNPRYISPELLHIFGNVVGIEDDSSIKITEEDDENDIHYIV